MSVKDAVTERFRELCGERGITVNELANLSGVTPSTAYSMMDPSRHSDNKKDLRRSGYLSRRVFLGSRF